MTLRKISVTSGGLTNAAYATGEVMGNRFAFGSVNDWPNGFGCIRAVSVIDDSATLTGNFELHLYSAAVVFGTDNNVPTLSDAENKAAFVGIIPFVAATDGFVLPNQINYTKQNLGIFFVPNAAQVPAVVPPGDGTSLSGYLLTRSTPAGFPAATNIQIDLLIETGLGFMN